MHAFRLSSLTTLAVAGLAIFLVSSTNVSAWTADVTFRAPSATYEDTTHTFSVEVENTGPDSMRLSSVGLRFDWLAENYYFFASGLPATLASGGTRTFSFQVHVPNGITTNTWHIAIVFIEAADPGLFGGWGTPASNTVDFQVFVSPKPAGGPSDGGVVGLGDISLGIFALVAVVVIAIVVALVVILRQKKPPPAAPVYPTYPYAAPPPQPPAQPPQSPPPQG